jgi:hypothetical protein
MEPNGTSIMEVRYKIAQDRFISEYLNFETQGNTASWWKSRSPDPRPATNQHAVDIANYHGVAATKRITVEYLSKTHSYKIVKHELGEMPLGINEIW